MKPVKTFIIVCLFIFITGLAFSLYYHSQKITVVSKWEGILVSLMHYYLLFIFLRTSLHLLLAFASLLFIRKSTKLKAYPLVSILVPCFNEAKVIRNAILSVLELSYPNYEIIIIDDGSTDGTLDEISSFHSEGHGQNGRIKVIHQRNAGKAEALNRGILEARGEFVFCMDADSVLNQNILEFGLLHMEDPNIAAVAGSVNVGNHINALTNFQSLEYISGLNLFKEAQSFLRIVTVIPGPVGLFRKEVIKSVGGYRSETLAEDCELTLRMLTKGHQVVYEQNMTAYTEVPDDIFSLIGQRYRWSRGVLKAIFTYSVYARQPLKSVRNFIIINYMIIESFFIPCFNFLFTFASINYALIYGVDGLFGYFFGQLVLLDIILAIFCITTDRSPKFSLLFYAIINRFTYGMAMEILRFFAIFDEILGLPLSWGKLLRKGMKIEN